MDMIDGDFMKVGGSIIVTYPIPSRTKSKAFCNSVFSGAFCFTAIRLVFNLINKRGHIVYPSCGVSYGVFFNDSQLRSKTQNRRNRTTLDMVFYLSFSTVGQQKVLR